MAAMGASGTPSSRPDGEHEEPVEHGDEQRAGEVAAERVVDDPAHLVGAGLARRRHHRPDAADDHLAVGQDADRGDHHHERGEGAAEETLAELGERLVVDAGGEVVDGLLDLAGGVGRPRAGRRRSASCTGSRHGGGQLLAEVAGLVHRRRRHQEHDGREEDHRRCPRWRTSCERFLDVVRAAADADELAETERRGRGVPAPDSPAPALHAALEQYDATPGVHSWLDTFWPYRYLGRRDRIALNANFFFLFKDSAPATARWTARPG